MTPRKRFLLGGGGALMPVLVSILAIDIGAMVVSETSFSTGNIIGLFIRYSILFIIGGFVAYLHEDELKPYKLFELGIAAPALITSLITAQGIAPNPTSPKPLNTSFNISLISSANAETTTDKTDRIIVAWGIRDIFDGASGKVYRNISRSVKEPHDTVIKEAVQIKNDDKILVNAENKKSEDVLLEAQTEVDRVNAIAEVKKAKSELDAMKKVYQEALFRAKSIETQALTAKEEPSFYEQEAGD